MPPPAWVPLLVAP